MCEQWKAYSAHCEHLSGPKPVWEGVLIFDEVKVQNGVRYVHVIYTVIPYSVFHSVQFNPSKNYDDIDVTILFFINLCVHVTVGLLAYQNKQDCWPCYDTR